MKYSVIVLESMPSNVINANFGFYFILYIGRSYKLNDNYLPVCTYLFYPNNILGVGIILPSIFYDFEFIFTPNVGNTISPYN